MLWKYMQYKCNFHQKQIVLWFPKIVNHVLRKVFLWCWVLKITPYTYTHLRETLSFSKIVGQQPHTNLKRTYWRCPNCHKDVRYLSGLNWTELNHIRSVGDINRTSTWSKSRNKWYVPESALPVEHLYSQSERALFGIHRSRGVTYPCGRPPFHRALRPLVVMETWLLGLVIPRMHASPQTLWIVVTRPYARSATVRDSWINWCSPPT
jgi:hypothetical protein